MSKGMKILMVCSLILNVLLIGFVTGNISKLFVKEVSTRGKPPELLADLSPEKGKLFSEAMEQMRLKNREFREQMRATREKIFSILTAPEFNEADYEAEAEKMHELRGLMMQQFSDTTKNLAGQFNREERIALATYLKDAARHHHRESQKNKKHL